MPRPELQGMRPGTVAMIKVGRYGKIAVVDARPDGPDRTIAELELEPGRYVVVPVKLWEQTVRKAMMGAELTGEGVQSSRDPLGTSDVDDQLPPTRQQRRRAKFDA